MRFSICEIYMNKANAMHALTHSQTWNAIYAHTESKVFNLWNLWRHSQRFHAKNDNNEKEVLIFFRLLWPELLLYMSHLILILVWLELSLQMCDLILKGDMQEMTTFSFSEVICNKRQHWEWGFQFVRYISPKLISMHALTHSQT